MADGYSGKRVIVDSKPTDVPSFSEYDVKCTMGNISLVYFPSIKTYFLNHWEVKPLIPLAVALEALVSYIIGVITALSIFNTVSCFFFIMFYSLGFILWNISYFLSVFTDPGFLPFFWFVEQGVDYTLPELWGGTVTNERQLQFAHGHHTPERSFISKIARRIVLRADHYCHYISNFVGLKNHKYFFCMLFWSLFNILIYLIECICYIKYSFAGAKINVALAVLLSIFCALNIVLFILVVNLFIQTITTFAKNILYVEKERSLGGANLFDLGCKDNIEQYLDPMKLMFLWVIPIRRKTFNGINYPKKGEEQDAAMSPFSHIDRKGYVLCD